MSNGVILANQVRYADTFAARFFGMMLKRQFPHEYDALLLTPCNSVHTFFMFYPLDLLFLDSEIKVLRIYENLAPCRSWATVRGAKHVLELAAGRVARSGVKVGDMLIFSERERRG
ncbi:MAG: DUF192 domain-containing protein [Dethiobacter sp.]|nr:DUF192 domain-containing protein [Dethiobacter sp.]MBS3900034.1 DUF192 domain-containing protein [Dethiobacter sp.]MBS3982970.1 DUF192 domain-containing protein [Dethiobacter sp.]MCL4464100.1 DUF192 domain-containing protein [Bacillota bacterium]MCL5993774.1 DUF192 domain-containing protein [Bacillota bacterium]